VHLGPSGLWTYTMRCDTIDPVDDLLRSDQSGRRGDLQRFVIDLEQGPVGDRR
jgi:hypothetical protein